MGVEVLPLEPFVTPLACALARREGPEPPAFCMRACALGLGLGDIKSNQTKEGVDEILS